MAKYIGPKFLFRAHQLLTQRMFDGRGMRRRHTVALAIVRWTLDRFELYAVYGRPW